jgi:hypothetical protein
MSGILELMMNKPNASLLYFVLAATAILGSFFSPIMIANAQSPMDLMNSMMMNGNGDSATDDGMMNMMMGDGMMMNGGNMSMMPFKMGVMVMPMMCTSPNEILGVFSGMLGGNATENGNGDNASEQMAMDMMQQQMMMAGGGLNDGMGNMSEAHLQQMMNMAICFPTMGGEMMKGMNGMSGMEGMMSMGQ